MAYPDFVASTVSPPMKAARRRVVETGAMTSTGMGQPGSGADEAPVEEAT